MDRIIMHIDVNNAFLSWTAVDLLNKGFKYDIRNSYAVIGGDEQNRNGIVLAKSTPAKKMGIKTAMTLAEARKLCPALKSYPSNYEFYSEMSNKLFELLSKYTNDIEIASIDECYLDYTPIKHHHGDEKKFADKLRKEVFDTLGFTINVGIANNKLTAKMASDLLKPNKTNTIYDNEIEQVMYPLNINDLFGIGKQTTIKLNQIGIYTIGDLANSDPERLRKYFKNMSVDLINRAKGIDYSKVDSSTYDPKGISNETTINHDVTDINELKKYLFSIAEHVGIRVRRKKKYANTIAVILKDNKFKRMTHQKKLNSPTNITSEIYETSVNILTEMYDSRPIRLIGIRLDNLTDKQIYQTSLFESTEKREEENILDEVVDSIKEKYGNEKVIPASLLENSFKKKLK